MFKQEFFSIQAAAERRKVSIEELICLAEDGKISVCFRHYGCVGLFRTTADGEHIVGFSPCQANDDDMIPHNPGDVVIVSGVFRSFMRPAILCQHPAEVWLRPTAIEVVTIFTYSEQPPVVPDGFVLGRVDAASRCLDDSPVRIDDWLFCRGDLDRLTEDAAEQPAAEQPAAEQPAAEQPATAGAVTVDDALEGKPADGEGQADATTTVPDEAQRQKPDAAAIHQSCDVNPSTDGLVVWQAEAATAAGDDAVTQEQNEDAEIAELFDPVPVSALRAMFPDEKWRVYAERAARNGLSTARVGRAMFNPYRAAVWWIEQGPDGWKWERCLRVLANNLPIRSRDSKHLLTGD